MAKKRIIPKLQLMESSILSDELVLVISKKYEEYYEIGSPVSQAKIYEAQCVDELVVLYLSPSKGKKNNRHLFLKTLRSLSSEIFIPIGVGGGIRNLNDIKSFLQNGADKVILNTIAHKSPNFVKNASEQFGSQCIVVSIDIRITSKNEVKLYSGGGRIPEEISLSKWVDKMIKLGAGELLFNAIDFDGTLKGMPIDLFKSIIKGISIPVIISGGCGESHDFIDGFQNVETEAIAAGTFFAKQDQNPIQTRSHIQNAGIDIRKFN